MQSPISLVDRAITRAAGVIDGSEIDWERYMAPGDAAKIVPADQVSKAGRRAMLLEDAREDGFPLPWAAHMSKGLIRPSALHLWTGWTHHGKSQMAKMFMLQAIRHGHKVLIASLEETLVRIWRDMAQMFCGTGKPTAATLDSFSEFVSGKLWFYNHQGHVDPKKMVAVIRYASNELGITQAVVDSLMLIAIAKDAYSEQRDFAAALKGVASECAISTHLVAHMRKSSGDQGDERMGGIHQVAGPHELASIADTVLNVWRNRKPSAQRNEGEPDAVLGIEKQRGDCNWVGKIGLSWHEESRQFIETGARFPIRFDREQE